MTASSITAVSAGTAGGLLTTPFRTTMGRPVILVEANWMDGYSDDVEKLEQIYGYVLEVEAAKAIVSTNGQYWDIEIWRRKIPTERP